MPTVNGKKFPYTTKGKAEAKAAAAAKPLLKKKKIMTDGGYMPKRSR